MISKDEAKKRMFCDWARFHSTEECLDALLSQNQGKIDQINACRIRTAAYNTKMELDIDLADDQELERLINTWTAYDDS